jgi:hypothetical protein
MWASRPGATRCREMLAWNHRLAEKISAPGFALEPFQALQQWQRERLAESYSDLMNQESYRPACEFFLEELYGGLDFQERDQEVARVMSVMVRFLPGNALHIMADAFELQALSLKFDMAMAQRFESNGATDLNVASYGLFYRSCGKGPQRERQIVLIREVGNELAKLVHKPFVVRLIRLMRGPAYAAGFGALQSFLESGVLSFRQLDDPVYFVNTIYERERLSMQKLFAGDAEPFLV